MIARSGLLYHNGWPKIWRAVRKVSKLGDLQLRVAHISFAMSRVCQPVGQSD
jgi:hypothetical protein